MSDVINKITGQHLISVHTPNYTDNKDWIINPTQKDIDKYTPTPTTIEDSVYEKEQLIDEKKREIAIEALISEGKLDSDGNIIK